MLVANTRFNISISTISGEYPAISRAKGCWNFQACLRRHSKNHISDCSVFSLEYAETKNPHPDVLLPQTQDFQVVAAPIFKNYLATDP
jgi:hypothetical protein